MQKRFWDILGFIRIDLTHHVPAFSDASSLSVDLREPVVAAENWYWR
jgi:hypothetical protein